MRDRGTFNFSGNLEVKKDAPLEARSLVNSYADLVKPETWTDEQGGIWKYDCMLVSCKDRPGKIYQLSPGADYTRESSWILIGDTSELNSKVQQFINSKGAPNGLASLNESGVIPSTQLPSYVDDVVEVAAFSNLPSKGESGKIYIVTSTNIQYRWSGTAYVEISKSIALGETSSTAYPGDKGKATTDVVNSLSDTLVNDVLVAQSNQNSVSLTIKSITKTTVNKDKQLLLADGDPILPTDGTPILLGDSESARIARATEGLYSQANDKVITINPATTSTAGVMSSSDKSKLDSLKSQAEIDELVTKLDTHISNKSNPHSVTKAQVGLGNVDNTSDANKPISTATQNALNSKFNASDGNALKQRVDNIPELIATDITVDSDNDSVNISLDKTSIVDGTLSGTTININSATTSKAGILTPADKTKIDKIITNGNGTKYLSDNGTYKEVSGGSSSSDINIIELRDIRDIINIVNHEKDAASSDISSVFGGSVNFRAIVDDIIKTHTRYFFHAPDTNCIQLSGVNAWKNLDSTHYELHFIYNYYISNGNQRVCRRVSVIDSNNTNSNLFIVENVNDQYVLSKYRDRRKMVSLVGEGFDENHWYPVSFTADPNTIVPPCNLIIWNSLNNDSAGISPKPSWATNNGGFVLHIDMTIIGDGYGQYTYARNKLNNWHGEWGGETAVGEMRQTTQTSTFYIYLRGGANYFYTSDYADLKMTAHSSEVSDGYNTYSIKDTQGDIKDFFTYVENDLFGEVRNLQIVHDNEFNFANDNIGNYVWINYRSRYDAVTSAKAIYIGNGQAGADGAYGAVHASGFFKESDIRLKSDIAPLKHTLDQICEIPTVEFNMHDKHQIGTIAQDLENNFAEVVNTDSDGMKSVDYCMLGVVAIEGIKLLKQEIEDLKKQIKELKNGR